MARNIRQIVNNLTKLRVGATSHYTNTGSLGRQTMAGTARVRKSIWIPATDMLGITPDQWVNAYNVNFASAASTSIVVPLSLAYGDTGSNPQVPVLSSCAACGIDARASAVIVSPTDADTTGSVQVNLYYTTRVDMGAAGCAQVFRFHYQQVGSAGSPEVGNSSCRVIGGSMVGDGLGVMEVLSLGTYASFQRVASPMVFMQLTVETSNACSYVSQVDSGSTEEAILGLELIYTACALGASSTE